MNNLPRPAHLLCSYKYVVFVVAAVVVLVVVFIGGWC